ncbi:NAD-dependent epimerase/dehydratase family protein [Humibacter ginsengisoli]
MTTLLLTGATGMIGSALRPRLARPGRTLRLLDTVEPASPADGEQVVVGSFAESAVAAKACEGVDLIVHLGGHSKEQSWSELMSVNVSGTQQLLEAARIANVPRILLASSIHAVGFLAPGHARDVPAPPPRPDSYYGVSKAAIEALGSLYADRYEMSITSVRIGTFGTTVREPRMLATWLSADDASRIVEACLTFDQPGHRVIWGVSNNSRRWFDLEPGHEIGYFPLDDAEMCASDQLRADAEQVLSASQFLGGPLATDRFPPGSPWI